MRATVLACSLWALALCAAQTTGQLGDASIIQDNPIGKAYTAELLPVDENHKVQGTVSATADDSAAGVVFSIDFWGFPDASLGPFIYHIHVDPVPEDGNCTKTLGHLDPFIRGETPPCDSRAQQTCQVGDLAGKHGKIVNLDSDGHYRASYVDLYASTKEGIGAFLGNRSIVVHQSNATRLNCGSFNRDLSETKSVTSQAALSTGASSETMTASPKHANTTSVAGSSARPTSPSATTSQSTPVQTPSSASQNFFPSIGLLVGIVMLATFLL